MESKRSRIARWLYGSGISDLLLRARAHVPSPWLTAVTYHRITAPDDGSQFDSSVYDTTIDDLAWQLDVFARFFTAVGVDELLAWRDGGALPRNPVVITFDDAYVDNYTHVLPLLARAGLKAVFFVPTRYVTERRVPWWDRIARMVNASPRSHLALDYPELCAFDLGGDRLEAKAKVAARLIEMVKARRRLDLDRFLDHLGEACDVPWDRALERRLADAQLMTWDQIRALRAAGMSIGSHTRTHRILPTLSPDALDDELTGARADLARELHEPAYAIAYPAGMGAAARPALRAAVLAAGYRLGFSGRGAANALFRRFDPLEIRRATVERNLPPSYFLGMLAVPGLAHPPGPRRIL